MRFGKSLQNSDSPQVTLTPLVDVVLQLLIFFMITTTFAIAPGLKVDLPKTVTRDKVARKNPTVTISRDGGIYLNDQQVTLDDLSDRLRELLASGEYTRPMLIIMADEQASHGVVVKVMDRARRVGIDRLTIATGPPPKEEK